MYICACYRLREVYPEFAQLSITLPLFGAHDKGSVPPDDVSSLPSTHSPTLPTAGAPLYPTLSGPQKMAQTYNTTYLGSVPMDLTLLSCGEQGKGLIEAYPTSIAASHLNNIVDKIVNICNTK